MNKIILSMAVIAMLPPALAQGNRVCVRWKEEVSMETRQFGTTITVVPVVRKICVEWAERKK